MIAISKEQIINSIAEVSQTVEMITRNPDLPMKYATYQEIYIREDDGQVRSFFNIFSMMNALRRIALMTDSQLDDIDNNDFELDEVKERIFSDKNHAKQFSNKQIIKFIRNAFAHSDFNKELFKLSPNGRFVEIDLKQTKPIPFHVKIDRKDLGYICREIGRLSKGRYCTFIDRKNRKLKRIFFKKIPNLKVINEKQIKDGRFDYDEYYKYLIEHLKENNIEYREYEYDLMEEQIDFIKRFKRETKHFEKSFADMLFPVFAETIVPLAADKINYLDNGLELISYMYAYPNYSYNQMTAEIRKGIQASITPEQNLSELAKIFSEKDILLGEFQYVLNRNTCTKITIIEYITFYFTCMCEEEYITLDTTPQKITLRKEFVRNALIHGRWMDDQNGNLILCDAPNGKYNDYNFHTRIPVSLRALFNYCLNSVEAKKIEPTHPKRII